MQLPFLVVHAALFWKVVLGAFVALWLAVFFAVRYALVRAGNRAAARDLDTDDPGVIRGTLRGGTASTLYVIPTMGASSQPSFHAGDLVIATADGDVVLDGEIRVAAGAQVAAKRRGVPASTPEPLAKLQRDATTIPIATAVLHEVRAGDEVIAKGKLVQEAGDAGTDYRENASRRLLRGGIVIAARTPVTSVVRPSLMILAVIICAAAFVGYKASSLCGDSWNETCRGGADLELTNGNACVMANAMPGREGALDTLLEQLDRKAAPNEASLQERIALSRLLEKCDASVARLQRIDRPELALAEAKRCGDLEAQEIAYAKLGQFAEAAAIPAPLTSYRADARGKLLVLAGAWGPAAVYAEGRVTDLRLHPDGDPDRRDRIAVEIVEWQCIAALMQFYADGSATSTARVRELAAGPHGEQCTPELAEIATDAERTKILTSNYRIDLPWRALDLEAGLAGIEMMKNEGIPAMLLQGSDTLGMAYAPALWATRLVPPVADTADPESRFDDATHRLAIAVWMHDIPAAHRYADVAIALAADNHAGYDALYKSLFHPMIDLYTAKTPLELPPTATRGDALDDALAGSWRFMTARLAIRNGAPLDTKAFVVTREMEAALTAAQHGDGALLASTLAASEEKVHPIDLIAVLPAIKTHREELVRELPWMAVESEIVDYRFPFGAAQYYAERRTMFELAGDPVNAKRVDDVFQRYVAAFHDHRRLVALALLDL